MINMKTYEGVDKSEVHLERAIGDLTVHGDIDETNAQLLLWIYMSNIEVVAIHVLLLHRPFQLIFSLYGICILHPKNYMFSQTQDCVLYKYVFTVEILLLDAVTCA